MVSTGRLGTAIEDVVTVELPIANLHVLVRLHTGETVVEVSGIRRQEFLLNVN